MLNIEENKMIPDIVDQFESVWINRIEELKADACAESLFDKDSRKFWHNVYKVSNNKASCHVNSIGGVTGPQNIANMWKDHFQQLYSSGANTEFRAAFEDKISAMNLDGMCVYLLYLIFLML